VTGRPVVLTALLGAAALATSAAEPHLLAGAEAFRAERYATALVEFRVAESLGSADASWYAAATLVKLGRAEDAVEGFALAQRASPSAHDALLDYYRALACYDARLYLCADRWLRASSARAGPRVAGQARTIREAIGRELDPGRIPPAIDAYLARAMEVADRRPLLALAYAEEALALAGRTSNQHRAGEARALIERLRRSPDGGLR